MTDTHRPVKVLHVFGRMQRGGAELRTLEVMRKLDRAQYELHFCALSGLAGELDDQIRNLGGQVHLVRLDWSFPGRFLTRLRKERYDVVHSHVLYSSGLVLLCAALAGVAVRIAHFRSTGDGQSDSFRRNVQRRFFKSLIDHCATNILAVSQGAMDACWPEWRSDRRCQIIYNGLDTAPYDVTDSPEAIRRELGLPEHGPLIIHVGRMDPPKNHERLIQIFSAVVRYRPEVNLLLVGRGGTPIESRVRNSVSELGLQDHVFFVGERCDVPRLLSASDLLLFPSIREGLPGVVLEACAAGIPVLSSDVPGAVEISIALSTTCCLSLKTPDSEWARSAIKLVDTHAANRDLPKNQPLLGTVFHIDQCVKAFSTVWRRG